MEISIESPFSNLYSLALKIKTPRPHEDEAHAPRYHLGFPSMMRHSMADNHQPAR
jgi:hypothetical protein